MLLPLATHTLRPATTETDTAAEAGEEVATEVVAGMVAAEADDAAAEVVAEEAGGNSLHLAFKVCYDDSRGLAYF